MLLLSYLDKIGLSLTVEAGQALAVLFSKARLYKGPRLAGLSQCKGPKHEVFVAEFVCFKVSCDIHNFIRKNPCKCMLHIC